MNEAKTVEFWVETLLELLDTLVSWPVAVAVILMVMLLSDRASRRLGDIVGSIGGFRSVKLFGAELIFNEEARAKADETMKEYRSAVWSEYGRYVNAHGLEEKLRNACAQLYERLGKDRLKQAETRFTVHVPDALFTETFVQLLNYYPSGQGAARTKSIRFGVIGKCWRSGRTTVEEDVPTEEERLIVEWGMTDDEARRAGSGRKSFAAVPLTDSHRNRTAVFFMDARPACVFTTKANGKPLDDQELEKEVVAACEEAGLTSSLAGIREKVWEKGLRLKIHD